MHLLHLLHSHILHIFLFFQIVGIFQKQGILNRWQSLAMHVAAASSKAKRLFQIVGILDLEKGKTRNCHFLLQAIFAC